MVKNRLTRRSFIKASAAAAGTGLLVACGGAAPTAAPTTAPAAAAPTTAPAAEAPTTAPAAGGDLNGKEGVLWGLKYDPHVEAYKRMAELFKTQTGATLKVEPQDWPLETKMIAALSAGTQPDAVCIMGKVLLPLHLQKALLPCTEAVYKTNGLNPKEAFIGDSVQAYTWQQEIWGVPVESNQVAFMVNVPVDDVKTAGLTEQYPPTNGKIYFESYEAMWELAKALQTKDGDRVTRWGLSSKGWETPGLFGIMRSLGVKWWDNDAKKFNMDSDAGVKAMEYMVEKPVKMGIETELDQTQVDAALAGKVAVARGNGTPAVQGRALGYNYELCGAPMVKTGENPLFVGEAGWGFSAPRNSLRPDISVAFLRMVATKEGQLAYAKIYDGLLGIAWVGLADDMTRFADPSPNSPNVKAAKWFTTLLPSTEYYGEGFGYIAEIEKAGGELTSLVRQGKLSSADGMKQLQQRSEAQYKQYLEDVKKAA